MKHLVNLCIFISGLMVISGQWTLPKLPDLKYLPNFIPKVSNLPTPERFLEMLLNVTTHELLDIVSKFEFDDIIPEDIEFLWYQKDGSIKRLHTFSDEHHIDSLSEPIKFIVHGWQSTGEVDFIQDMAESYHSVGIHNIFGVDWSAHSKQNYLHSARGTKKVGEVIAMFIMNLIRNDTRLLKNVHLIGHSLGAHASGFAGKHIKTLTNGHRVQRITGLDAAGPLFEYPIKLPGHLRLTNEDAEYVDAMHTNIGFLGVLTTFGDADYYVNFGGPIQPGCLTVNIFESIVCSHGKVTHIYNETITSDNYLATSCENPLKVLVHACDKNQKVIMGEYTTMDANGEYFIYIDDNKGVPVTRDPPQAMFGIIPGLGKLG